MNASWSSGQKNWTETDVRDQLRFVHLVGLKTSLGRSSRSAITGAVVSAGEELRTVLKTVLE